jgi:zinc protease
MNRTLLGGPALLFLACATAHPPMSATPSTSPATDAQANTPPTPAVIPPKPLAPRPFAAQAPLDTVVLAHAEAPIVSLRFVFRAGSVDDPPGKEGLTALTAALLAQGGTQSMTTSQLLAALYPMAAELGVEPDKELTTFTGRVHKDLLGQFLPIALDVLTAPRFDPKEFERLRADAVNGIRNGLRGEDDEELGKVGLDALLYAHHPYAHDVHGTVQGLLAITLDDVKAQYKRVFTQDRLLIGLAGPVDDALVKKVKDRLSSLPSTGAPLRALPAPAIATSQLLVLKKPAASTAISLGFAYGLRRGDPDFIPVAFAASYLGQHREASGVLFQKLRELRGLNYGTYAYAEAFEQAGESTLPALNIARQSQAFTLWIRPVDPDNAAFATRAALHYFDELLAAPIPESPFEQTRGFLLGYSRLLEQTDERRLGYALDDKLYGTPHSLDQLRNALKELTPATVQAAVQRQLASGFNYVFVTQDTEKLLGHLKDGASTPVHYVTPPAEAVRKEDEEIQRRTLPFDPERTHVQDAQSFMEK